MLQFWEHEMEFVNVAVESSGHRGATFPNSLRGDDTEEELYDLHSRIGRARNRDQHALPTFKLDLTEALSGVVSVGHDFAHVGSPIGQQVPRCSETPKATPGEPRRATFRASARMTGWAKVL